MYRYILSYQMEGEKDTGKSLLLQDHSSFLGNLIAVALRKVVEGEISANGKTSFKTGESFQR